jgi:dipeptidyl aminopeptidase/acylaminoacyl peptidase
MRGLAFALVLLLAVACNGGGKGLPTATPTPYPTATATPAATPTPAVTQTPFGAIQPVPLEEGAHITEQGVYLAEVDTGRLWQLGQQGGTWSPDGKTLLSAGCCVGQGGLDLIDVPAGSAVRILSGDVDTAAWSPDGSQIALSLYENGPKGLYVINRDGSGLQELSEKGARAIRWSPLGGRIAFRSLERVYLLDVAKGEIEEIAESAHDFAWSPDGRWRAFNDDSGLYLYEPESGERRQLAVGESSGPILWSPDGSRIAFRFGPRITMSYGGYAYDPSVGPRLVHVVEVQGSSEPQPLPPARNPSWSPDSTSIAYLSEGCITGRWGVFSVRPDGSSAVPLTDVGERPMEGPVWSPVGSTIAFSTFDRLMLLDADSQELRSLAVSGGPDGSGPTIHLHGSDWSPAWSSDGRYIQFSAGYDHGICD